MRTDETTCAINGLKVDVMLINQESASNSLISQFDSVQVINRIINKYFCFSKNQLYT